MITSSPNVVSRPQAPRLRNVLRFHNFIGFASWFLRKWGTVCENWIQWAQLAQMWFQGPRPQGQIFFCGFIILLDYSHDSWENVVLPVKIGARFLDLWLDKSCEPNWPKCSFLAPGPKSRHFLRFHDFIRFASWFLRKWGPICENWSQDSGLMAW